MSNLGQAVLDIVGLSAFFVPGLQPFAPAIFAGATITGSILFPNRLAMAGPKLMDLKTTSVTIGAPLIIAYGTIAVPGNVIYLGLLQTVATDEGGGCGGDGPTVNTYYQTVGVALCAGPILGVQRIWENGKLVYDIRPQQLGETATAYSARLTANATYATTFVLYLGTDTQGVDPTIETDQGAGNAPAFRGLAYIVYPNRQLQDSQGLRHPQAWKFEVIAGGTVENTAIAPTFLSGADDDSLNADIIALDAINGRYYIYNTDAGGNAAVLGFNVSDNTQFVQRTVASMGSGIATGLGGNYLAIASDGGVIFTNYDSGDDVVWRRLDPLTLATDSTADGESGFDFPTFYAVGSVVDYTGAQVNIIASLTGVSETSILRLRNATMLGPPVDADYSSFSYGGMLLVAGGNESGSIRFYVMGYGTGGLDIYKVLWTPGTDAVLNPDPTISSELIGNVPISAFTPGATVYNAVGGFLYDPAGALITTVTVTAGGSPNGPYLLRIDTTDAGVVWSVPVGSDLLFDGTIDQSIITDETLYVSPGGSSVYQIDLTSGAVTAVDLSSELGSVSLLSAGWVYAGSTGVMVAYTSAGPYVLFINKAVPGSPSIGEIVTDISSRVGYSGDQIDVSDFVDGSSLPDYRTTVLGYAIGSQMTARDAISPLMNVGFFDVIAGVDPSSNMGVLRFQARGKPIAHTLVADDLGAYQFGGQAAVEWQATRALDTDLPRFIRVHYLAPSRSYDNAEQISPSRMTSSTVNDVSLELAIALQDDQAAKVAAISWQELWATRETYAVTVDDSLSFLEPGDAIQIPIAGRNEPVLIKSITRSG